jgi:hypothetical protein
MPCRERTSGVKSARFAVTINVAPERIAAAST